MASTEFTLAVSTRIQDHPLENRTKILGIWNLSILTKDVLLICTSFCSFAPLFFQFKKKCSKETKVNRFESSLTVVTETSGCDSQPTSLYFTKQQKQLGKSAKMTPTPTVHNLFRANITQFFVHPFASSLIPPNMDSFITKSQKNLSKHGANFGNPTEEELPIWPPYPSMDGCLPPK